MKDATAPPRTAAAVLALLVTVNAGCNTGSASLSDSAPGGACEMSVGVISGEVGWDAEAGGDPPSELQVFFVNNQGTPHVMHLMQGADFSKAADPGGWRVSAGTADRSCLSDEHVVDVSACEETWITLILECDS